MFAEDLSAFFDTTSGFAVMATVGGASVPVIFDAADALGAVGAFGMAGTQPQILVQTALLPTEPVGASVVVGGGNYVVATHQPDGTGISTLLLEVAP